MRDGAPQPRLLDQLRDRIRLKHYSIRTDQPYLRLDWTIYLSFLQVCMPWPGLNLASTRISYQHLHQESEWPSKRPLIKRR